MNCLHRFPCKSPELIKSVLLGRSYRKLLDCISECAFTGNNSDPSYYDYINLLLAHRNSYHILITGSAVVFVYCSELGWDKWGLGSLRTVALTEFH